MDKNYTKEVKRLEGKKLRNISAILLIIISLLFYDKSFGRGLIIVVPIIIYLLISIYFVQEGINYYKEKEKREYELLLNKCFLFLAKLDTMTYELGYFKVDGENIFHFMNRIRGYILRSTTIPELEYIYEKLLQAINDACAQNTSSNNKDYETKESKSSNKYPQVVMKSLKELGLTDNFKDFKDIKKAYIKNIKMYHPDMNKSDEATEKTQIINSAYATLESYFA